MDISAMSATRTSARIVRVALTAARAWLNELGGDVRSKENLRTRSISTDYMTYRLAIAYSRSLLLREYAFAGKQPPPPPLDTWVNFNGKKQ